MSIHVRLGTRDEKGAGLVQGMEAGEIDVGAIHDVDRPGFRDQHVEGMDVVQFAVRDVDQARDAAPQVEQGMHLHRRLGGAEMCPRKNRQAQIDGRRIQRVDGLAQVQAKVLVRIQLPCLEDQPLGQLGIDAPVAPFVGIGQCRAPDWLAEAHVIELRRVDRKTGLDVS